MLTESTAHSRLFLYMIGNWLHRIERAWPAPDRTVHE
jgi:hypothetical protein